MVFLGEIMSFLIYKLTGDNGLIYYGSTTDLEDRLFIHKNSVGNKQRKGCMSWLLEGHFKAEVLESNIPHKHIAIIREGYYIRNFPCVNKHNPDGWWHYNIVVPKYRKDYREKNREKINHQSRAIYENLKDNKIVCGCGSKVHKYRMKRHLNSEKHQKYLNTIKKT